ncbi:AAA family ATPase [Vibrio splendidus]
MTNLFILPESVFLSHSNIQHEIIEVVKEINKSQPKVKLIIIDTLARCFIGDENSSTDMNSFIKGCDKIKQEALTSIICVHHVGKDANKGMRGSSSLLGTLDFSYSISRTPSENSCLLKT